ncbi:MAG: RHS repeat-associated core domain-containing protein [Eubacterium sp.]
MKQRKNDRGILVCDSSTNETIGYISPPNLEDGNGDVDYENVEYKLKKENSETEIEVKLNRQYFDNESLKYPVKVDPTMVWMSDYLATRGVWSVPFMADSMMNYKILNVTNYLKDAYPYNSENRIYLDTTNLLSGKSFVGTKTPLKGKYIESAELIFSESKTPDYYPTGTVQVKRALAKWDKSTITWNSQPKISDDYIAETQCTGEEGNRHTLDITDWVQDIADGKLEDNGLVFTCPEKGMAASIYSPEIQYSSSENGKYGDPLYMAIAVNYREMKSYDETVELNAEYANDENNIQLNITDNNTDDGVTVTGYKIYARKNNASVFSVVGKGTTIDETIKIASDNEDCIDLRACLLYSDGTDPWLKDSDFDEIKDSDDFETTNPRKTDNPQNKGTDRLGACSAEVHKGLYDREYSEYDNGVKTIYLKNIYRNDIKKVTTDYGDENLNKVVKYFYDEKGNNTAVVEENQNDKDHTICITYTYDSDGNVIYICDQKTAYTMEYQDSEMKSLKVGNIELVNNSENIIKSNDEASDIAVGEIINSTENTTTYGNNQKIRTVTTEMKVAENDTTSVARKVEIYYDTNSIPAYTTEYNDEGKIIKFTDNTEKKAVSYNYIYTGDNVKVERNDGFIKTVNTEQNEESGITQKNIEYTYKDILDRNATYKTTQKSDMSDENKVLMTNVFYNNAVLTEESSDNEQTISRKLYSSLNGQGIFNVDEKKNTEQESLYTIIFSGNKKVFSYIYDLAGNITEIKLGDKKIYEYAYDVHGRITKELDYVNKTGCTYGYTSTGNVVAKHIKEINNDGSLTNVRDIKYSYQNGEWADQLTQYDGQKITYDGMGNPIDYIDGKTFKWTRGRQLEQMTLKDGSSVTYKYNQDGLRTYKDTKESITNYQWDDSKLIRETVAYKGDEKKYDIWYFYNNDDEAIGFEYSEVDNSNIVKTPIYFEKNKQGDVIGLLDTKGKELVKYSYDAWGNIVDVSYENETALKLNHITYRGYYKDNESGFYYLQSRYYDSETGRFINADDVKILGIKDTSIYKDNLYCYCNNNVVNCTDPNGKSPIIIYYAYEFIKACVILVGTVIAYCSIKKIMNSFKEYCKLVGNGMSGIAYTVVHGGKRAFSWGKSKIKKAIKAVKAFTEVAKAEAKIRSRVKRTSKTRYWSATLKKGYVDIGRPLSYSQAVKEVSRRHNVFTVTKAEAKAVAKAAGDNKKPTKAEIDKGKNGIIGYYWHYHTYNRNGAHVWYLF